MSTPPSPVPPNSKPLPANDSGGSQVTAVHLAVGVCAGVGGAALVLILIYLVHTWWKRRRKARNAASEEENKGPTLPLQDSGGSNRSVGRELTPVNSGRSGPASVSIDAGDKKQRSGSSTPHKHKARSTGKLGPSGPSGKLTPAGPSEKLGPSGGSGRLGPSGPSCKLTGSGGSEKLQPTGSERVSGSSLKESSPGPGLVKQSSGRDLDKPVKATQDTKDDDKKKERPSNIVSTRELARLINVPYDEPFLKAVAPHFRWAMEPMPGSVVIEEGINAAVRAASVIPRTMRPRVSSETQGPPPIRLTAAQVQQEIILLAKGVIGEGSTSIVFKCTWAKRFGGRSLLAIKVLKDPQSFHLHQVLQMFEHEADVLSRCRHPNIVRLYGYCLETPNVCLIMELLTGTLKTHLHGKSGGLLDATNPGTTDSVGAAIPCGQTEAGNSGQERDGAAAPSPASHESALSAAAGSNAAASSAAVSTNVASTHASTAGSSQPDTAQLGGSTAQTAYTGGSQSTIASSSLVGSQTGISSTLGASTIGDSTIGSGVLTGTAGAAQCPAASAEDVSNSTPAPACEGAGAISAPASQQAATVKGDDKARDNAAVVDQKQQQPNEGQKQVAQAVEEKQRKDREKEKEGGHKKSYRPAIPAKHVIAHRYDSSDDEIEDDVSKQPQQPWRPVVILRFAVGIASGLAHLHALPEKRHSSALHPCLSDAASDMGKWPDYNGSSSSSQAGSSSAAGGSKHKGSSSRAGGGPGLGGGGPGPSGSANDFGAAPWAAAGRPSSASEIEELGDDGEPLQRVAHRDLKPSNILINSLGQPKLSDFGLAREHSSTTVYTEHKRAGTLRYMAPELLTFMPANRITDKVDIYSLGVVLWELGSRQMPWKGLGDTDVASKVQDGKRPPLPDPTAIAALRLAGSHTQADAADAAAAPFADSVFVNIPQYSTVIMSCWQTSAQRRPTAQSVHKLLMQLLKKVESAAPTPQPLSVPRPLPQPAAAVVSGPSAPSAPASKSTPSSNVAGAAAAPPESQKGNHESATASASGGNVPPASGPAPSAFSAPAVHQSARNVNSSGGGCGAATHSSPFLPPAAGTSASAAGAAEPAMTSSQSPSPLQSLYAALPHSALPATMSAQGSGALPATFSSSSSSGLQGLSILPSGILPTSASGHVQGWTGPVVSGTAAAAGRAYATGDATPTASAYSQPHTGSAGSKLYSSAPSVQPMSQEKNVSATGQADRGREKHMISSTGALPSCSPRVVLPGARVVSGEASVMVIMPDGVVGPTASMSTAEHVAIVMDDLPPAAAAGQGTASGPGQEIEPA